MKRCPDCNSELSACGEMTDDGPAMDCLVCQLRSEIRQLKELLQEPMECANCKANVRRTIKG